MSRQAKRKMLKRQKQKQTNSYAQIPTQPNSSEEQTRVHDTSESLVTSHSLELTEETHVIKREQILQNPSELINTATEPSHHDNATKAFSGDVSQAPEHSFKGEDGDRLDKMEIKFRKQLQQKPNNEVLLYNLVQVLEQKRLILQASHYAHQLVKLFPQQKQYKDVHERLNGATNQSAKELDPAAEAVRIEALEQKVSGEPTKEELWIAQMEQFEAAKQRAEARRVREQLSGTYHQSFHGKISRKRSSFYSAVTTKIINSKASSIAKPLFNSITEYKIYKTLLELFPNYFVVPNAALQSLFFFDKVKELLNGEEFEYYLKAHVDFCILRATDYFPLVALELDSDYHLNEEVKKRDEFKNKIFQLGGIDLLRFHPHQQLSDEEMQQEIIDLIQIWQEHIE